MVYQIISYLKFLKRSTNQHGVHSPFVYDLVTKCFYLKQPFYDYKRLKAYRKTLLKDKQPLKMLDLGKGSRKTQSQFRTPSELAKTAGTPLKRAKLLLRLTNYFHFETILELGTSLGMATHAMTLGNPKAQITSVDGNTEVAAYAANKLAKWKNIHILTGSFEKYLPNLKEQKWDAIFFDGNHTKKATLEYFETLLPSAHNDSVFIFDDIYWSPEMTEAWEIIKSHPQVTVTIDTYYWGLVFFRKEQQKEHFTIRV